jgi:rsbT co-antagonist protein RsbR
MTDVRGAQKSAATAPFTAEEQAALADVWEVYHRHYDEVLGATMATAQADPALAELMSAQRADENRSESERNRSMQLTQAALHDGDWEPYLANVRDQGRRYARGALPIRSWFPLVTAAQGVIVNHLIDTYTATPQRLQAALTALNRWLFDVTMSAIAEQYLDTREAVIRQQQEAIKELSTPVLPIRPGLILLPVIGLIDTARARQLTEQLLEGVREHRARVVVMDLTGVPAVDSAVANHLLQTVRAAGLLGARTIVTGISTANAQTLTRLGVDVGGLVTTTDLQRGIEDADWLLKRIASHESLNGTGAVRGGAD